MAIASRVGKKKKKSKSLSGHLDPWSALMNERKPLARLYSLEPMERIEMVREGAPSEMITFLVDDMAITKDWLYRIAGVARATMDRKVRAGLRLSRGETERIIGIARLVGQVEQMVSESGDPRGFNAGRWLAGWLDNPVPALGGRRPATLMDTADGRELVSGLLAQMQSGAYA